MTPFSGIVRTVREFLMEEETPADEPAGGEFVGAPAPTAAAATADHPIAFVGGKWDKSLHRVVYTIYEKYSKSHPDKEVVFFKHTEGDKLANWIDQQKVRPIVIGHSMGAATSARTVAEGHEVYELRTVDPVGGPHPDFEAVQRHSETWINYDADPAKVNWADRAAWLGGPWNDLPKPFADHYDIEMHHDRICDLYCLPDTKPPP